MQQRPRHPQKNTPNLAAIVLVVVLAGLTLGGFLMWRASVNNNEINRTISMLEHYQAATKQFNSRFEGLPGDIRHATRIWGSARGALTDGYDAKCAQFTEPSEDKKTCNGNGDGWIFDRSATPPQNYERFRYWQHLANADLIDGTYSGIGGPHDRGSHHVPGVNTPTSPFSNGVFVVSSSSKPLNDINLWKSNEPHTWLELRSDYHRRYALLTPAQMYAVDSKMDDGKPATGRITSYTPMRQPDCANSKIAMSAVYQTNKNVMACSIIYTLEK